MAITRKGILDLLRTYRLFVIAALVVSIVIIVAAVLALSGGKSTRAESYKEASGGAAGLQATVAYDCERNSCDTDTKFDFNVYIFKEDGQQVSVVRPNKDGKVNIALPEGNYIMLLGKRFGGVFPQESVSLKNGQELELKLHYK
jgi:hypothetical protein